MLSFQRFSGFIGAVSFLIVPLISSTAVEVITPSRSPTLPGGPTALPTPTSTLKVQYIAIGHALAFIDEDELNIIPPIAVYLPLPAIYFSTLTSRIFPVLGYHYFTADGTPFFDLSSVGRSFYGKKTGDLKAPANANTGPAGTGAVDWLQLQDKGGSVGIVEVFRVVTAGGAAPATCTTTGVMTIPYAAEYWFYDT